MNASPETISRALSYIPPTDRDLWVRMGMAAKAELGEEAFPIWNEWSKQADNYNTRDAQSVWRSIKTDGRITAGTLFYEAKARGFEMSREAKIDPAEIERHRKARAAALEKEAREREERQNRTAEQAIALWERAQPIDTHPYLEAKGIKASGARLYRGPLVIDGMRCDGALIVPIRNAAGQLRSLQFMGPDGTKRYLPGGEKSACYHSIGKPGELIYICEGFATGASIHEATGQAVVVSFDAGNLLPVATIMRDKFPDARLVLAADNDQWTPGNPGVRKAREAAEAVNGRLAIPEFTDPEGEPTDFNDLARQMGHEAVREALALAAAILPAPAEDAAEPQDEPNQPPLDETSPAEGVLAVLAVPQAPLSGISWPTPRPIQAPLLPVKAFDPDALLPECLREWVMDEADRKPCPPDFIAAAVITALGAVVGANCAIRPKMNDDWQVVPNLWGGIVGLPSAKKSPAITSALAPLDRLIADAMEAHKEKAAAFEAQKVAIQAQREAIEARIKGAAKAKSGEARESLEDLTKELQTFNSRQDVEPILRRFKTNDSTVEKLGELLRDNPRGLLALRDELVGLIASWDREGREGERAFFLESWNGTGSFDTDRIARGSIFIENLCLSVFGGIQPDKLTAYLEQAAHSLQNDGMLQRFQVLVYPNHAHWEWRDRKPNKAARDAVYAVFKALAEFDPVGWGAAPKNDFTKFPSFSFDARAQEIFIQWSTELHDEKIAKEESPIIQQHLSKYDKLFPAIALILHLVDCATDDVRGPVTAEAALRAAAWCDYLESHARRCYGLLQDDGLRSAIALSEKIQQRKLESGFTARDVRRNQWRYLTSDEAVRAALDWLEADGWIARIEPHADPKGGRPTVAYDINPAIQRRPS